MSEAKREEIRPDTPPKRKMQSALNVRGIMLFEEGVLGNGNFDGESRGADASYDRDVPTSL